VDVADHHADEQSEGSSSEECCSSSSSSDSMPMSAPAVDSTQEDLPSAAADSHQGDDAAAEPLLQDNPDRFTLGEIQ
jgi:hypothetical protein